MEQPQDNQAVMQKLMNDLYEAYRFFNRELFNNLLPDCAIAIGEKRGAHGVYYAEKFVPLSVVTHVEGEQNVMREDTNYVPERPPDEPKMDEILLNPASFNRGERDVLSTLVHEQVHQWESEYGTPGRNGYHNRQWAESMKAIGLFPSTTGEPGGKETGRKVTHYIIEGGLFDVACDKFLDETDFSIEWAVIEKPTKKSTPRKRTYRCDCPQPWYSNLSGRTGTCGECEQDFIEDEL